MGLGDFVDKAKDVVGDNADKADELIDKAGDMVDEKTDGKFEGQVDKGQEMAKDFVDGLEEDD